MGYCKAEVRNCAARLRDNTTFRPIRAQPGHAPGFRAQVKRVNYRNIGNDYGLSSVIAIVVKGLSSGPYKRFQEVWSLYISLSDMLLELISGVWASSLSSW